MKFAGTASNIIKIDLIPIIESIEFPEIDEDPLEEEDWIDFINIFHFWEYQIFQEHLNYFIT